MSDEKIMIPLLLTATVNPNGMQGASFSVDERARMYVEAVCFYLDKGCRVVFAENYGCIDAVRREVESDNVEWLDVSGTEYVRDRGKGYNETLLIRKAIKQSRLIAQSGCFFKVTGRLKVLNIQGLLEECQRRNLQSPLQFLADCKDHNVYELLHLPINGHAGECRYWFASVDFFQTRMSPHLDSMNDFSNPPFLAEDAMLVVCRENRGRMCCKDRFRTQARISGKGGHDLGQGLSFFYSTDNDSFALRTKCWLRQLLRWVLPWWRC